jgi:REP element-mobilizing transposase RayT
MSQTLHCCKQSRLLLTKDGVSGTPYLSLTLPRKFQVPGLHTYLPIMSLRPAEEKVAIGSMARRLRVQYPGAIYHLMARGNGRQDIVRDDADRDRLVDYLGRAAVRCSWRIYAFVVMSNHLHAVLKTPEPNLSRGTQTFLSAYANAWSRRHRAIGHVFQGRYRTELIEDES